jgi:hypothetical protein
MVTQQKPISFLRTAACLCAMAVILFSCESTGGYIGKYITDNEKQPGVPEQVIELQEKGQGVWRQVDEEVSFTWNLKKDEIRLHLKLGGVVKGKINNDTIEMILPGQKVMVFRKYRHRQ